MIDPRLNEIQQFIAERTGIQFRSGDTDKFISAIEARMRELKISDPDIYRRLITGQGDSRGPSDFDRNVELKYLTAHLVPGESYFFRDTGQIDLIESEILPEIIARRRQAGDRRLRIWSAGCSTGEEPYSLAALVFNRLPDYKDWDLLILGTDPNEEALRRAETGRYSEWSFRQVSEERRARYFRPIADGYQVSPEVQALVKFRVHDLHAAHYPEDAGLLRELDLIVCRNVFIYLQPTVIADIVAKMQRTLTTGGYLLTGHGELTEARPDALTVRVFPASIVYQKDLQPVTPAVEPPVPQPKPVPLSGARREYVPAPVAAAVESTVPGPINRPVPEPTTPAVPVADQPPALVAARELVAAGANLRAIQLLNDHLAATPADNDAGYLLARAHANLGDHTAAALVLQTILKREPFGVRGYFLLAQISEEQGDLLRAMELLKRSIYIDAAYIPGYLELGLLYQRQGEAARARTMLTSARELLKGLPAGTEIEEYNGETAEQLMELVAASLT